MCMYKYLGIYNTDCHTQAQIVERVYRWHVKGAFSVGWFIRYPRPRVDKERAQQRLRRRLREIVECEVDIEGKRERR